MVQMQRGMRMSEKSVAEYQAWMYRELAARRAGLTRNQRYLLGLLRDAASAHVDSFN